MDRIVFGEYSIFLFKNPRNRNETNLGDTPIENIDWEFAYKEKITTIQLIKQAEEKEQELQIKNESLSLLFHF